MSYFLSIKLLFRKQIIMGSSGEREEKEQRDMKGK